MGLLYIAIGLAAFAALIFLQAQFKDPKPPDPLTDEVIARLASEGRFRLAVKWYRTLHGSWLSEAKQATRELQRQYEARRRHEL